MNTIENQLSKLFGDSIDGYSNSHDISFWVEELYFDDILGTSIFGKTHVVGFYPGYPTDHPLISLEVFINFESLQDFIDCFAIEKVADLDVLTPELLLSLYESGKAGISCSNDSNSLDFRKVDDKCFASDMGAYEREVSIPLINEMDFIKYTGEFVYPW